MSSFKDDYSLLSSNVSALLSESTSTVITNIIGSDFRPGLGNFVSFFLLLIICQTSYGMNRRRLCRHSANIIVQLSTQYM